MTQKEILEEFYQKFMDCSEIDDEKTVCNKYNVNHEKCRAVLNHQMKIDMMSTNKSRQAFQERVINALKSKNISL
jgi:predicted DNA-binding protein YlxM (UPF0122 family)